MISGMMIVNLKISKEPHFGEEARVFFKRVECGSLYILKFPLRIEVPTNYIKNTLIKGAPFLITKYGEVVYA